MLFRSCIAATNEQAAAAAAISQGDLSAVVKVRCEADVMAKSLIAVSKAINALVADANTRVKTLQLAEAQALLQDPSVA